MRLKIEGQVVETDLEYQRYSVDEAVADAYAKSLCEHILYVQMAGRKIGVPASQLEVHDESKWTLYEFPGYARHFKGDGDPDGFATAWLHHIHYNPHHWQHWIFPGGHTPKGSNVEGGVVEMPRCYVLEMVADWMGAEMAYGGSWNMTNWLSKHISKIKVHSATAEYLVSVLGALGYTDVVSAQKFASGAE